MTLLLCITFPLRLMSSGKETVCQLTLHNEHTQIYINVAGVKNDTQLPVENDFLLDVQSWHLAFWKFLLIIHGAVDMKNHTQI